MSAHLPANTSSIARSSGRKFALLAVCALLWLGVGLYAGLAQSSALAEMNRATTALRGQMQADMDHDAIRGAAMSILAAQTNPEIDRRAAADDLAGYLEEFRQLVDEAKQFEDSATVRSAAEAVSADLELYVASSEVIAATSMRGEPVSSAHLADFSAAFDVLEGSMAHIGDELEAHSALTRDKAEQANTIALIFQVGCFLAIAITLLLVWRGFASKLIRPVIDLRHALANLRDGDLTSDISHSERDDEIGSLAQTAADLRDQLKKGEEYRHEQAVLIVDSVGKALSQLAQGDLSARVDQDLVGVFSRLKDDYNQAAEQLAQTMRNVRSTTSQMHTTGGEISMAVDDLSLRNEEQASRLLEITEQLSRVTQDVSNSAETMASAQSSVRTVNSEVSQGDVVIKSAVEAMDKIEESSGKIGSIIAVIDGISFQTNLLALNAGVEAARAGEAGKGFAVVANEVRELAQRSADAANEIKALIQSSNAEVETGVRLVREAGSTLQAITTSITNIANVIDTASASAAQQVTSLRKVDNGAKSLEKITQSNAALAEQVSASTRHIVDVTQKATAELDGFVLDADPATGGIGSYSTLQKAA